MNTFTRSTLLLFLIFFFTVGDVSAGHVLGAEISYKCLGSDKYEVTVKGYRDCNGASLSNVPLIVTPVGSGTPFNLSMNQVSKRDITRLCDPSFVSKCSGGSYPFGVQEYVFTVTIDLSTYSNCQFMLSWSQGGRSSTITTGMADQNLYVEALLDKCLSSCNNSPKFTNPPYPVLCVARDFCYNHGVVEPDGDSLSFSLVEPLQDPGVSCTYAFGYNKNAPLMFAGHPYSNLSLPNGFHLNSRTGELCFRPGMQQIAVVAVKVQEWRNINGTATLIGEVTRDVEYIISSCNNSNSPPIIKSPYTYEACAGNQLCFTIQDIDTNVNDSIRITWDKGIPVATFTTAFPPGSKKERGTFCWTPNDSDARALPYNFTAIAKDNFCPQPGANARVFSITVKLSLKGASRKFTKLGCGKVLFEAVPVDTGQSSYKWTIKEGDNILGVDTLQTNTRSFTKAGRYYVELEVSRTGYCSLKYKDTLDVDTFLIMKLPADTSVCKGAALQLASMVSNGKPPYHYSWNNSSTDTNAVFNFNVTATNYYTLTVTDAGGCIATDLIWVSSRAPLVNAGSDRSVCLTGLMQILTGAPYGGSWSGTGVSGNIFSPQAAGGGLHKLTYAYTDATGCTAADEMTFEVRTIPVFAGNDSAVCKNKTALLSGTPVNGSWSGPGVAGNLFNSTFLAPGSYELVYKFIDTGGCSAKDTLMMQVHALPVVNAGADTAMCVNGGSINLSGSPAGGSWSGPGTSGNTFDPAGLSAFKTIVYTYSDNNGCSNNDSRNILVNSLPPVNAGNDLDVCKDGSPLTLSGTPSNGTWTGPGVISGKFDPAVAGPGTHKVWLKAVSANGCEAADTMLIQVVKPVADFSATPLSGNRPLTVMFSDLSTGSHNKVEWDFGDVTSSQNTSGIQNPLHVYQLSGIYSVKLKITETGISCSDTLTKINYIIVSPGIGVVEISDEQGIYAYPNPASKTFDVFVNTVEGSNYTLRLHDISGKKVKELHAVKNGIVNINCEDLEAGMYFLELSGSRGELYKSKIILR